MRLELKGITKRFGSLVANQDVDLVVEPGEVHALLGENGAGKTTLMNVLFGLYRPDEGEILVDGHPVHFARPRDALRAGIGMVHQHFMLASVLTVAENVVLGDEPTRWLGFLDRRRARSDILAFSRAHGLGVDPDAVVEHLPVGLQQRVEIVKVLLRGAQLLVLDEPTAVLTPQETEELFAVVRSLTATGCSVLFITHKLGEVLAIADRITVLRGGRVVGTTRPSETSERELAATMVGREVGFRVTKKPMVPGAVVLTVKDLVVADSAGSVLVDAVTLNVRTGEILVVAGVQGNGQTEFAQALVGLLAPRSGSFGVAGHDLTGLSPHDIAAAGVGYVPEDRQREGLVLDFTVAENLVLDLYDHAPFARGPVLDRATVRDNADQRISEFDVRASADAAVGTLSGGNQQKIVLAREFSRPLKVLVASQPTRGLDVGSTETIYRRIVEERDHGAAVVVISSDLDEVLGLADTIAVMYRGRINGYAAPDTSREAIGLLMAGAPAPAPHDLVRHPEPAGPGGHANAQPAPRVGTPTQAAARKPTAPAQAVREAIARTAAAVADVNTVVVTVLGIASALIVGAVIMVVTNPQALAAWGQVFAAPGVAITTSWNLVYGAYAALLTGSVGSEAALSETLVNAAPLMLAGLSVTLALKAGMFNIGAQGQIIVGAIAASFVGFSLPGLPLVIHLPLALLAAATGGAVMGAIPGVLKARTGAHEVIVTIMLNYIALNLLVYVLGFKLFEMPGAAAAGLGRITAPSAMLPHLAGASLRVNLGIVIALVVAIGTWWLLRNTTLGFRFRMVGANSDAARAAGVSIVRMVALAMTLSGMLAGLAGGIQITGVDNQLSAGYSSDLGFIAITVALLGRANPIGVILGSLLYGGLEAGGLAMQAATTVPLELVVVIQAVIVLFIAAPAVVRDIYRIKTIRTGSLTLSKGWGG